MTGDVGIGLDIGASKTHGVLLDAGGDVLAQVRLPTAPGSEGVVATAAAVVDRLLRDSGTAAVPSIGAGMPGVVDVRSGAVKHAVNLGLDGAWVPMREELTRKLGAPVHLENDVNAAAFGATTLVEHASARLDLAYLSIGTGLAAGLVLGGELRRGARGAAGEIGHVPVDPHGERCACGQNGCLEVEASGSRLHRAWPVPDGRHPGPALFEAAAQGDPRAVAARDRFAAAVATAVRMLCLTLDVDRVVIGGGVAQMGEPLKSAVERQLHLASAGSPFLHSLDLSRLVVLVPRDHPVAAVGAALLGIAHRRLESNTP